VFDQTTSTPSDELILHSADVALNQLVATVVEKIQLANLVALSYQITALDSFAKNGNS
jgi:hypothetical protein